MFLKRIISILSLMFFITVFTTADVKKAVAAESEINLLKHTNTGVSIDDAIKKRRTTREFDEKKKVTLQELSNILFVMQGQTQGKKRTVPSAMGAYPLELYIVANNVTGLEDGLYKMDISKYALVEIKKGDLRSDLSSACMGQMGPKKAQIKIIITCVWKRMSGQLGELAKSYGFFEAGGASQNAYLMAAAQKLNVIPVGGIDQEKLAKIIGVNTSEESPVIVNCIGR